MMRTTKLIAALCVMLLIALQPAVAGPAGRTVTVPYEPNMLMLQGSGDRAWIYTVETDDVVPAPGEAFASFVIADGNGQPVAAAVHQGRKDLGWVCGSGSEHVELVNDKPIHLHLQMGMSTDCGAPSVPTQGTVEVTFHK